MERQIYIYISKQSDGNEQKLNVFQFTTQFIVQNGDYRLFVARDKRLSNNDSQKEYGSAVLAVKRMCQNI